nr:MAG TPA: protein of unknown function DUF859 [Caudoviricetes sp.]
MTEYWSNNDRGYRIQLIIDQVRQNSNNNTSDVRFRVILYNTDRTFSRRQCKWYVEGFGQYTGDVSYFAVTDRNSNTLIVDKTVTVEHTNGNNTFNVSAYFYSYGNADGPYDLDIKNQSVTLNPISLGSSISAPGGIIGETMTITINKRTPNARHTVRYRWGENKSGIIAENVDTSCTWKVPEHLVEEIPTAAYGWGELFVDTYVNGNLIQTQSAIFTASLSLLRAKPYFSGFALADANEKTRNITQSTSHFVSVLSRIYARFDGVEAKYGATITKHFMEIVGNNNTISAPNGTFREISVNKDTQFTLRGYVEDSRGFRSEIKETTFMVLNYFSPTLRFEVVRSGETNSTLTIKRFAKVAPLTVNGVQKNTMKLTFTTRQIDSDTETIDNGGAGGNWSQISEFNASNANLGNSYPADTSYIVVGKLEDKFTSVSFQATEPGDRIVMSCDKDGIGINKYREKGALDVDGLIYSNRKQIQHHKLTEPDGAAMDNKVDNLNDYRTTGFYSILGNYRNHPASGEGAYLEVVESVSGYHQTLTTVSGRMFKRTVTSNSNGSWIEYTPKPEKQEPAFVKRNIALGYRVEAVIVKKGNIVTLSIPRNSYALVDSENKALDEKIPEGFRPCVPVSLLANKNFGNNHVGVAVWHLATDGGMSISNRGADIAVYTGTVTYLTEDN